MQLHKLKSRKLKSVKRVGRGISAGRGKTCGRGTKGQKSRSGAKAKPGFEGGQSSLIKRLPKKRGFYNIFSTHWQIVNVGKLNELKNGTKVNIKLLYNKGIIRDLKDKLKILGDGVLDKKLEIYAHSFSKQARKKIEQAGGKAVIVKVSQVSGVSQVSKEKKAANLKKTTPQKQNKQERKKPK